MRQKSTKDYWNYIISAQNKVTNTDISMEIMYDYFKTINEPDNDDNVIPDSDYPSFNQETMLNSQINEQEIRTAIKMLKNNKASGIDKINKYIKQTELLFLNLYTKVFNIIFDTGILPECWLAGIIKPIYKNKGSIEDPNNYRPITILSCMGKLFTGICFINRINFFFRNK